MKDMHTQTTLIIKHVKDKTRIVKWAHYISSLVYEIDIT